MNKREILQQELEQFNERLRYIEQIRYNIEDLHTKGQTLNDNMVDGLSCEKDIYELINQLDSCYDLARSLAENDQAPIQKRIHELQNQLSKDE